MNEKVTVEPGTRKGMTAREAARFMASWWRIVAWDGSTIAYVPDESTASFMASILNAKLGRKTK
ncbi:MAG TPA: hypothetical protein VMW46_00780 [Candidatus Desulfaltia sp.]|nr:hypothetical protein [Candidatus Desulfaltia sp.]